MKKKFNTKHHKAGATWNGMNMADRGNWLANGNGSYTWQSYSWTHLPESLREAFITALALGQVRGQ
jgi:hypothetical protein